MFVLQALDSADTRLNSAGFEALSGSLNQTPPPFTQFSLARQLFFMLHDSIKPRSDRSMQHAKLGSVPARRR